MSTFSCEYKHAEYLHLFITDGLYNKIKNILTFQLSFGNWEKAEETTAGKKQNNNYKLTRRKSAVTYNMITVIGMAHNRNN